ncbi:MAG: acyl-CoA dehydratase activase, partial [Candidatus Poribacteria bacterium]
ANSKYIRIDIDETLGVVGIQDYERNGECAAGTGSFIDQQATRLQYDIEDIGDIVMSADKAAIIAGRCSVFAKSDMIHAQQKGYQPPQILKGLCEAVVRNFKGSITKGKKIEPKVAFIGGVAANRGVVQAMKTVFKFTDDEFFVPESYAWMGAIGAALLESEAISKRKPRDIENLSVYAAKIGGKEFPTSQKLSMEKVTLLRDRVKPYSFDGRELPVDAYLGVDVGSVSTNLVVLDGNGDLIKEIYTRTRSRPIEVVGDGLKEIEAEIGAKIRVRGVGTTGSGRELIGKLIGADTIKDEITAHKTGATFVGGTLIDKAPDTIFEVGGQDSKYISIQDGIVVDFTMNEACAAGTGSFLEEQAERMGISIISEFAELALSSQNPIRLGERCTVFMEKDITPFLQRGASKEDLTAGLAYSIAINYLNRVVRGRKIGETIYFQGGTAYNDAVAAAFSTILDKEIIVPPYNGVIGAIGAALLAKGKVEATQAETTFRGFSLDKIDYTLREFTCKACSNYCDIQEFKVESERTYWGDKCSDQFRTRKIDKEAVIPDLMAFRQEAFMAEYEGENGSGAKIGIPRGLYFYERFPFWNRFLSELGFDIILSSTTNKEVINLGVDAVVAEPCFPIKVMHGHVNDLLKKEVDYIFIPHIVNAETKFEDVFSHVCPWSQTVPFVIKYAPLLEGSEGKLLRPMVHFRDGIEDVKKELRAFTKQFGISKRQTARAVEMGYEAQNAFRKKLLRAGEEVLEILQEKGEPAIVLVGRPYNIYDSGVNLDIPRKLRDYYGVNVIPMDFLPLDDVDISDVNPNMFWSYGRKILQASKIVARYPNLHILHITNFKCGPDSYIKHFINDASQKPYLSLQFDGHSNDAGFMTRCEAYLDSKGFLRWWARES